VEGPRLSEFDVVVFGATGVTGRQVGRYLTDVGANWAAAGRDAGKVERTLAKVGARPAATITADVSDPASLEAMAARTKVVLDLAGPYTILGRPVIAACVASGAHYADLTGEIPFVREIIDEFDAAAREAGVKIVQVCGFEALPPDLAVRLAVDTARERWDAALEEVDVTIAMTGRPPGMPRASDMISGGTFQSMAEAVGSSNPEVLTDPAALIDGPEAARVRDRSPIEVRPRRGANGDVIAPMSPAAFINPAVIQRSAVLAAQREGVPFAPFRYREGLAMGGSAPTLPLRYAAAATLAATQYGMRATALAGESMRNRVAGGLRKVLPGSGFGPQDPERLAAWRWQLQATGDAGGGRSVTVTLDAEGHPGYLATARMLGEAGLMMAEEGATPDGAGCLTPSLALGTAHLDRFKRAGLHFSVA
jgi:short subunit dehydrogenase-like uncharacterized protein